MRLKTKLSISIIIIGMLFSCSNDVKKIKDLNNTFKIPPNTVEDFELYITDSSILKVKLISPLLVNNEKENADETNREFPKGLTALFYDNNLNVENSMRANYSIYFPNKHMLEAMGRVVVTNKKNDSIISEKMYWNQKTKKIYSDQYSRIIQDGNTIIGKNGFEADENFSWYKIYNTEGNFFVKDSI